MPFIHQLNSSIESISYFILSIYQLYHYIPCYLQLHTGKRKMYPILLILFFTVSCLIFHPAETAICNEAICASVVSKCMLTQSCKCDLTHCSCCKDCYNCLSYLYSECCSCVGMNF